MLGTLKPMPMAKKLLKSEKLRESFPVKAREHVDKNFSLENMVEGNVSNTSNTKSKSWLSFAY